MAHKVTIGLQSVPEIMFLPVREMAEYSHLYPELFDDIGRI